MLTAHLPAGYLVARAWPRKGARIVAAARAGAMIADLDMAWGSFIDHGWVHHHSC